MNPVSYISEEGLLFNSKRNFQFTQNEGILFDMIYSEDKYYHDGLSILEIIFDSSNYVTNIKIFSL